MTERDSGSNSDSRPKLPFSETQRVYKEGVENLIRPMLDDPESVLSKQLEAGDAAFVDALNILGGRKRRLIPIALPIDYKPQKQKPENAHNMAQLYLNGDGKFDQTLQEVGDYYSASREAVRTGIQRAVKDVIPLVEDNNISFESLNFAKLLPDSFWKEVIEVLNDPEIDRVVKRKLILEISRGIYYRYSKQIRGETPVFISVSEVARKAGLFSNNRTGDSEFLAEYLGSKSIPVGYLEYVIPSGKHGGGCSKV